MRGILEIQEETKKVEIAKRQATHKVIRCEDRLTELEEELQRSINVKCVCDECRYLRSTCPTTNGEGTVKIDAGKVIYCSEIARGDKE